MPVALTTSRMRLLFVSAMKTLPAASTATSDGALSWRAGGGTVVAAVAGGAGAGDGDDVAGRLDHVANDVVARVGDVEVAGGVQAQALGGVELGVGRGSAVAAVAGGAGPAKVMMLPVAFTTWRMRLLPVSAM